MAAETYMYLYSIAVLVLQDHDSLVSSCAAARYTAQYSTVLFNL